MVRLFFGGDENQKCGEIPNTSEACVIELHPIWTDEEEIGHLMTCLGGPLPGVQVWQASWRAGLGWQVVRDKIGVPPVIIYF